jgi:hypothetical protein
VPLRGGEGGSEACVALAAEAAPDGVANCFCLTNLGVEAALDPSSSPACLAWLHKIRLHSPLPFPFDTFCLPPSRSRVPPPPFLSPFADALSHCSCTLLRALTEGWRGSAWARQGPDSGGGAVGAGGTDEDPCRGHEGPAGAAAREAARDQSSPRPRLFRKPPPPDLLLKSALLRAPAQSTGPRYRVFGSQARTYHTKRHHAHAALIANREVESGIR